MPPGVYFACPLPTPCEETPAPSTLHPAPWHLESEPPFAEKVRLAATRPGKEKDKTHLAISLPCHPLNLLPTRPGSCPPPPLFPLVPMCCQHPVCSPRLSPSAQSPKQHFLTHELHSVVLPRWARLSSASPQGRRRAAGGTPCAGTRGFAASTEIGHPSQRANCAAKRKSGFAEKGKESQSEKGACGSWMNQLARVEVKGP